MQLLEIVRTIATSEETLEIGKTFGQSLGKTIVVAQDTPGFIVNRLLAPYLLNAIRMLEANIASREDIDTGIQLGLSHPMGPLTLADLIGLDIVLFVASAMYEELKELQYAPPTLLKKMVTAGWLGRKAGKGFYEYKK
jgi:3-hydroxybutyryl-CoA dehydrogenase